MGEYSAIAESSQVVSDSLIGFGSSRITLGEEVGGQAFQNTSNSLLDTKANRVLASNGGIWKMLAITLGGLLLLAGLFVAIQSLTSKVENATPDPQSLLLEIEHIVSSGFSESRR
jgi:hypothetical protein